MDASQALIKARALCAKQERHRSELSSRFEAWDLEELAIENLLAQLEREGFLNERRFAEHFAVSKLRQNGWGRLKIRAALEEKGLTDADIEAGLAGIDEAEYHATLQRLAARRVQREDAEHFLTGRGFEDDLIEAALRE